MIFPNYLSGPKIENGYFVSFSFDQADFLCRLPEIPNYEQRFDIVSPTRDFTNFDVSSWDDGGDCWLFKIAYQSWKYEDEISHHDIAICGLTITLIADKPGAKLNPDALNPKAYLEHIINLFASNYGPGCAYRGDKGDYYAMLVGNGVPIGVKMQAPPEMDQLITPKMIAYIPLNLDLSLMICFTLNSLHYDDRKNPYSEELLHQFKIDLFDEFLSYIQVTYSGEVLKLVEQQAKESD